MAVDPSIYAAFAPRPRSAVEYAGDFAQVDAQREAMQANALQRMLGQAKLDELGRQTQQANALREFQRSLAGKSESDVLRAYRDAGYLNEASALEEGMLKRDKTRSEIAKEAAAAGRETAQATKVYGEAQADALKRYRGALDFIDTPQGAQRWLQAQYADPLLAPHMQALGPIEQAVTRIPNDPQGFTQWRQQAAMGMERWMTQQLEQQKAGETARSNQERERTARGQLGVAQGNLALARTREGREAQAPRGQFIQTPDGFVLADPRTGSVMPVTGPDGKPLQGKTADRALTEGQAKANLFGTRMQEADRIIGELAAKGVGSPSFLQQMTGGEGVTGRVATAMASPEQQQIDQAQRDFINAVLRRESGAVISPQEFENARKQYFVQPGDKPQVIEQKARNRQTAIGGMLAEVPEGKRGLSKSAPTAPAAPGGFKYLGKEGG